MNLLDRERFLLALDGPIVKAADWQAASAANDLVAQAHGMLARVAAEAEQARQQGRAEGHAAGRAAALAGFADELRRIRQLKEDLGRRHEDAIIDLATAIVARIAPQLGADTVVPAIAAEAVRAAAGERYLTIRIAPAALPAVQEAAHGWRRVRSTGAIDIVADDTLAEFDCVIETEIGILRAGLNEQLAAIRQALHEAQGDAAIAEASP